MSGGVRAPAPRPFVHAYMMCNAMIEGELAHSCVHEQAPHRTKVCLTKTMNKAAWPKIEELTSGYRDSHS